MLCSIDKVTTEYQHPWIARNSRVYKYLLRRLLPCLCSRKRLINVRTKNILFKNYAKYPTRFCAARFYGSSVKLFCVRCAPLLVCCTLNVFTLAVLDLNATIDRLHAGTPGNRFETVDFRSESSGGVGGGAVTSSTDVIKSSTSHRREEEDDDDDIAAAVERAQLDDSHPAVPSHVWDTSESSPC